MNSKGNMQWFSEISQISLVAPGVTGGNNRCVLRLSTRNQSVTSSAFNSIWLDSLMYPVYCAVISALAFIVHFATTARPSKSDTGANERRSYIRSKVDNAGGPSILVCRILQLLCILALLGISMTQLVFERKHSLLTLALSGPQVVQVIVCAVYVCHLILSAFKVLTC